MHLHVVRQGPLKHRMEKESKKSVNHTSEEGRQAEGHENLLKKKGERKRKWEERQHGIRADWWEGRKQQTSLNFSSEMIYLSTLWQHRPSGPKKLTKFLIMEAKERNM